MLIDKSFQEPFLDQRRKEWFIERMEYTASTPLTPQEERNRTEGLPSSRADVPAVMA